MRRLPITQEEKRIFKSLEKTAMILLLMFKIHPTPLDAETLSYEMKIDRRTADNRLNDLASEGFTLHMKGQGYVLTSQTRSLVAQLFGSILVAPLETQALTPRSTDQASAIPALALSSQDQALSLDAQDVVPYTHTVCALKKEEEDSFNLINSSSSDSDLKSAQNAQISEYPPVLEILAATPILFKGSEVFSGGLDLEVIEPWIVLAWLAQAYDAQEHKKSYSPAGMAYKNLQKLSARPEAKYLHGWRRYLPAEFLEALGLIEYDCKSCVDAKFSTRAAYEEHVQKIHPVVEQEAEESVELISPLDSDDPAVRTWDAVKASLQAEMPRAHFDSWVRNTQAVHFDGSVLSVGVGNSYARDWLEDRLESTVNRLLIGILNAQVTVKFVVAAGREEDEDDGS